jgi:hypothetical protein
VNLDCIAVFGSTDDISQEPPFGPGLELAEVLWGPEGQNQQNLELGCAASALRIQHFLPLQDDEME